MKAIFTKFLVVLGVILVVAPSVAFVTPDFVRVAIHRLYTAAKRDHASLAILSTLNKDAYAFALRAKQAKLSLDDQLEMFRSVEHLLLTPSARIDEEQRVRVAAEIVAQAATPAIISQGAHSTCSVTTIEIRAFTLTPQVASDMIVTEALSGEWKAPSGQLVVVKDGYARPGQEESKYPVPMASAQLCLRDLPGHHAQCFRSAAEPADSRRRHRKACSSSHLLRAATSAPGRR